MSDTFFHNMGALRRLVLANLNLDPAFMLARGKQLFSNLSLLEEVDLSLNGLFRLQPDLFTAQPCGMLAKDVRSQGEVSFTGPDRRHSVP